MRKYIRSIAKARLQALGIQHVNRHFGNGGGMKMPLWRRVIFGNLAKDGWQAQMGMAKRRRMFAR